MKVFSKTLVSLTTAALLLTGATTASADKPGLGIEPNFKILGDTVLSYS